MDVFVQVVEVRCVEQMWVVIDFGRDLVIARCILRIWYSDFRSTNETKLSNAGSLLVIGQDKIV